MLLKEIATIDSFNIMINIKKDDLTVDLFSAIYVFKFGRNMSDVFKSLVMTTKYVYLHLREYFAGKEHVGN